MRGTANIPRGDNRSSENYVFFHPTFTKPVPKRAQYEVLEFSLVL